MFDETGELQTGSSEGVPPLTRAGVRILFGQ